MRADRRKHEERGFVLLVAMVSISGMLALTAVGLTRSLTERASAERFIAKQQAFYLAESGVDAALRALAADATLTVCPPLTGLGVGTAGCSITNQGGGTRLIRATGFVPHAAAPMAQKTIEAVAQFQGSSVFQFAAFGTTEVRLASARSDGVFQLTIDSFDSQAGSYNPATATANARIGTNATPGTCCAVTLAGDDFVMMPMTLKGQVQVGPGVPNPASVVALNTANVTGTPPIVAQGTAFSLPPISVPPDLDCSQSLFLNYTTHTLPAGTYCYADITVAEGRLTTDGSGPVTIFVTGGFQSFNGSVIGVEDDPTAMAFYVGGGASFLGYGQPGQPDTYVTEKFYGAMYSPSAPITGDYVEVHGSLIGNYVNVTNVVAFHYDEALQQTPLPASMSATGQGRLRLWRSHD